MRSHVIRLTLSLALLALLPTRPAAAASLKDELLRDWADMKQSMLKLADEMPADKYTFKATPPERTYGEQVVHVATANIINLAYLHPKTPAPMIDRRVTTKAEAMKAMAASFDYGTAVINEQTDATLLEVVDAGRFLGQSTKARVVWFLLGHSWDIYGQMAVYLRLSGGVPPASQRP